MILGLEKNTDKRALRTVKAAPGLFVVMNAYEGHYEYFAECDSAMEQPCYGNSRIEATEPPRNAGNQRSRTEIHGD